MVLLLALSTAKRVSGLRVLSVSLDCMRFAADGRRVLLEPHIAFVPGNMVVAHAPVGLVAFHPPPFTTAKDGRLHCLCPVRALRLYCQKTEADGRRHSCLSPWTRPSADGGR